MVVCDQPPKKAQSHIQSVKWTGKPKRKLLRQYLRWCHLVNSLLADLWQVSILRAFQTRTMVWEWWTYRPGQAPKRKGKFNTNPEVAR
jgi:hypothetical protein